MNRCSVCLVFEFVICIMVRIYFALKDVLADMCLTRFGLEIGAEELVGHPCNLVISNVYNSKLLIRGLFNLRIGIYDCNEELRVTIYIQFYGKESIVMGLQISAPRARL